MPNYKVFQDNPDQMKIKIYGNNNVAFNLDDAGNVSITTSGLAVTGNVDVGEVSVTSTGLAVTGFIDVGEVSVTSTGLAVTGSIDVGEVSVTSTGLAVTGSIDVGEVSVTSTGLAVTGSIDVGEVSVTSTGLAVTGSIDVGTVTVTTGSEALAVCVGTGQTSVVIDNLGTTDVTEIIPNVASETYSGATVRTVLGENAWTFAIKNNALEPENQAVVQIQMSATAQSESDWLQEVAPVTLNQNSLVFLTSSLLVKYARVYYKTVNAASPVTLSIVYQAQK